MPLHPLLTCFQQHLPYRLFTKIKNFTSKEALKITCALDWNDAKQQLDAIDLEPCRDQLINILTDTTLQNQESNVTVFHIAQNHLVFKKTEPKPENITQMVYKMLATIYQRTILTTIIKYILLKPLVDCINTSTLTSEKRGIFFQILTRLNELVFENLLLSFNGANYDNHLICNSLIVILSSLHEKIKIFKKGSAISTAIITIKKNVPSYRLFMTSKSHKKRKKIWPMKLYLKDVRNLVAPNMSLDKLGRLFNLPCTKLAFPYEQATSIKTLKKIKSLNVDNEQFWNNTFSGRAASLEDRQNAQLVYDLQKCKNLYEFSVYYLKLDCVLLHSIVLTLYKTYLFENLNIVCRRNFSQSNLAYQQLFIVEPSRQINHLLAPVTIDHTFYNYIFKQAVTGGLCTSFVHGKIDKTVRINEIFNYIERPTLCPHTWPNIADMPEWRKGTFNETPAGISTIDIRSLYPSASVKKLPVGQPLFFTRFTKKDHEHLYTNESFYRLLNINQYCNNVCENKEPSSDIMQLLSEPPKHFHEYNALVFYLKSLQSSSVQIIRFQSGFTAFGQLRFLNYPLDGFLSYRDPHGLHIHFIQYHSVFAHGHRPNCKVNNSEEEQLKYDHTLNTQKELTALWDHFKEQFKAFFEEDMFFKYVEIWDCDFDQHCVPKDPNSTLFPFYKKQFKYSSFLDKIHTKQLNGLIVVKNLEIASYNQTPMMGFIISKMEYGLKQLSPYTQNIVSNLITARRVVAVHKVKGYLVLSTEYYNFLRLTFGFAHPPEILHAIIFQQSDYLRASIEKKLIARQILKAQIKKEKDPIVKQNHEVRAELIKLMLNSCYGFTLCNLTSNKFRSFENRRTIPKSFEHIKTCFEFKTNVYLVEKKKKIIEEFSTLLGHVGCKILFYSKIIFSKRLLFISQFLCPTMAQILYMDTDSAHILVKHKKLVENVRPRLRDKFLTLFDKHFETGPKISGIWVEEGFFENGEYLGEKCYRLYNSSNSNYLTHMKGLNSFFQHEYHTNNLDPNKFPYLSYNNFHKTQDFLIFKTNFCKNLFTNYVPTKRYFVSATGSLPLNL